MQEASMACHEGEGEVAHLREHVEQLPDVARRSAPAWRSLRHWERRWLLGMIGSSSWMSGEGVGAIWQHLVPWCGFWPLLAGGGPGGRWSWAIHGEVWGCVGCHMGACWGCAVGCGCCWVVDGRMAGDEFAWMARTAARLGGSPCG